MNRPRKPGHGVCGADQEAQGPPTEELVRPLVGRDIDEVERALILQTLVNCAGNRTLAAQILGVSVRTIHNKLRRWRPMRPGAQARPAARAEDEET